jgi:hypothetical protein
VAWRGTAGHGAAWHGKGSFHRKKEENPMRRVLMLSLLLASCGPQESVAGKWTSSGAPRPNGNDPAPISLTLLEDRGIVSGIGSLGGPGGIPVQVAGIWSPPNLELNLTMNCPTTPGCVSKMTASAEGDILSGKIVGRLYVPGVSDWVSLVRED